MGDRQAGFIALLDALISIAAHAWSASCCRVFADGSDDRYLTTEESLDRTGCGSRIAKKHGRHRCVVYAITRLSLDVASQQLRELAGERGTRVKAWASEQWRGDGWRMPGGGLIAGDTGDRYLGHDRWVTSQGSVAGDTSDRCLGHDRRVTGGGFVARNSGN